MNTNDSDNGTLLKASEEQVAANQNNAKKSTGPKSAAGKAIAAKNGIAHGIHALCPVIRAAESSRDWTACRKAMLASLKPVDGLEAVLAERITLTTWRLRRVVRFEREQIQLAQEAGPKWIGMHLGFKADFAASDLAEVLDDAVWHQKNRRTVQRFAEANDDAPLSQDEAWGLLFDTHNQLGLKEAFDDYWQQLPDVETWTVGCVRQLARAVIGPHGKTFEHLLQAMQRKAIDESFNSSVTANKVKQKLDEYRRENLLPDTETLEKVMRYEAHLSRQFHRDLHELQRLQALRQGLPVAAPLAIDVDVTGEPKTDVSVTFESQAS